MTDVPVQTCRTCPREFIPITPGANRCGACLARRQRVWISVGITTGVVAAVAVAVVVMPIGNDAKATPKPADVKPPVIGPAPKPDTSFDDQVIASCDPQKIENLVDVYKEERKWAAAIRAGELYQKKCPRHSKLDWDILYAEERLEHWDKAEVIVERLMKEDPTDTDFWWWRGKVRRHLGKHAAAVVDLRQSLSWSTSNSNGVQIDHLDKAATEIDRRCEAAFGLRWLANIGMELSRSAEREMLETYFAGDCKKLDGTGELAWKSEPLKRPKITGTINGKKLTMMIDRNLGTTLVRRSAADKLELVLDEGVPPVDVKTPTGIAPGTLAVAAVSAGKAKAADVPVAIVEELPEGIDAVIGLSFLWRFDVQLSDEDGESFKLTPSRHE